MADFTQALANLEDKFTKMVSDITTLTVRTFTGEVSASWSDGKFQISGLDQVKLEAMTKIELDGDTDITIPTTADGTVDKELLALHNQSVASATAARAALVKAVGELLQALRPG